MTMNLASLPSPAAARQSQPAARRRAIALAGWALLALVLVLLPLAFSGRTAVNTLSLIGIMVLFSLSFNVLLGQTGLLSLGHGMFFGLGGFFTVHAVNALADAGLAIPLPLMPVVGALGGLVFGLVFGWVATRRGGMAFAMITLGLGELVYAASFLLPTFFGGEEGKSMDRTSLGSVMGFDFGPQIQVYYLIAFWCFVSAIALYSLARTPLGLLCRAVRENTERIEFLGYRPETIRFLAFAIAAMFGGLAGGLAAINFEIMTASNLGSMQSTMVLLMTYIGGIRFFAGPALGAVLITIMQVWLSDITPAWQLYFGLLFIAVVMFAPGGLAGICVATGRLARSGRLLQALPGLVGVAVPALIAFIGLSMLIELGYRAGLNAAAGPVLSYFGVPLDTGSIGSWLAGIALLIVGSGALHLSRRRGSAILPTEFDAEGASS